MNKCIAQTVCSPYQHLICPDTMYPRGSVTEFREGSCATQKWEWGVVKYKIHFVQNQKLPCNSECCLATVNALHWNTTSNIQHRNTKTYINRFLVKFSVLYFRDYFWWIEIYWLACCVHDHLIQMVQVGHSFCICEKTRGKGFAVYERGGNRISSSLRHRVRLVRTKSKYSDCFVFPWG